MALIVCFVQATPTHQHDVRLKISWNTWHSLKTYVQAREIDVDAELEASSPEFWIRKEVRKNLLLRRTDRRH